MTTSSLPIGNFTARQDCILSPRGQDCIKRPYWPGLHSVYLLDKFTARQDYTLSLCIARTVSSVPAGQDHIKSTYLTSLLLDRTTPCLHVARTASSLPAGQDNMKSTLRTSSLPDKSSSCVPTYQRRTFFLPIKTREPKCLLSGQDCI